MITKSQIVKSNLIISNKTSRLLFEKVKTCPDLKISEMYQTIGVKPIVFTNDHYLNKS